MDEADKTDKVSNTSEKTDDSGFVDCTDVKLPPHINNSNKQHLKCQMSPDVFFIVGDHKEKFSVHKKILQNASQVFKDIFHKGGESKSEFDLHDIEANAFREILRHIYCGQEQLSINNVMSIIHAADYFKLPDLKHNCQTFLHNNLEVNNSCRLLTESRCYECLTESNMIIAFIEKNLSDVLQTKGIDCLSRGLLNEVLTLPTSNAEELLKKQVADRWGMNQCLEKKQDINDENIMAALHGCFYVERDDSASHRYVMDSLTSRNLLENSNDTKRKLPKSSSLPNVPSAASPTTKTVKTLSSANIWPDLEKVTRLQEVHTSDINDALCADAISFAASHDLLLYGFSIYGPRKQEEGKYQVDSILYRKREVTLMETTVVKGAGVLLPVMLEKPVRIIKNSPYTLEAYITGPESYIGTKGLAQIQTDHVLFTFQNATKVKRNRSDVSRGQIPQIYFLVQ